MQKLERDLNALLVIILATVLLSAYGVQFFAHEQPCPLCMLQRLGMLGVAIGGALNLYFGIRVSHYAVSLLSAIVGGFVALRQISLHVCPGTPSFGIPVLGLSLYTWSFIVFVCSALAIALLLFLYDPKESSEKPIPMNAWSKFAFAFIFIISFANIITTFTQCGWGPCVDIP